MIDWLKVLRTNGSMAGWIGPCQLLIQACACVCGPTRPCPLPLTQHQPGLPRQIITYFPSVCPAAVSTLASRGNCGCRKPNDSLMAILLLHYLWFYNWKWCFFISMMQWMVKCPSDVFSHIVSSIQELHLNCVEIYCTTETAIQWSRGLFLWWW